MQKMWILESLDDLNEETKLAVELCLAWVRFL